jgi:hypothetical protein
MDVVGTIDGVEADEDAETRRDFRTIVVLRSVS